jgi:hypothetical protein
MSNNINSIQIESTKTEILISKIITGITIIYLFTFIIDTLSDAQHATPLPSNSNTFPHLIYELLRVGVFCFQVFLIVKLIYPFKSKYHFINLERGFHPFFMYNGRFNWVIIIFLLGGVKPFLEYFENQTHHNYYGLVFCFHLVIMMILMMRRDILNSFPISFMKSNKIRILIKYQDYINHKIADDEPHLTINQNFDVNLKSLPRYDSEKNLIEIKNPNTPVNPSLVYKIEDKDLAQTLRDGYVLKAKLIEIKEEGNLEIELWLKNIE